MKQRFLIILSLFLIFFAGTAVAALPLKKHANHQTLTVDTSKLNIRHLDSAALEKYRSDPDFDYTYEKSERLSLWQRFWIWFWNWISRFFPKSRVGANPAPFIKYFLIGILTFGVTYLIFRLLKIDFIRLFKKRQNPEPIPYHEFTEDIHAINFDDTIAKAIADKNYRLAVRLLYLRSLKQLNDAGLIKWRLEKTNLAYLSELENEEHKKLFGLLTLRFEYVWYGDFPINKDVFQNIDALFSELKNRLS